MLSCFVFLYFKEILLRMATDLKVCEIDSFMDSTCLPELQFLYQHALLFSSNLDHS